MKLILIWLFLCLTVWGQMPTCENPEAKAFDWQIGVWQSEDAQQTHEIKKTVDDCIIIETWKTDGRETAVALKSFDNGRHHKTGEKKWFYSWTAKGFHQLWEGRKENGEWIFYRNWFLNGEAIVSRTFWKRISADRLERIVEQSRDEGKIWRLHLKDVFLRKTAAELTVRNGHSLVFDENAGKSILFGGADSERVLNDTQNFDGFKWVVVPTQTAPAQRTFPAMIYDSERKKTLLFGGNRVLFGKDDSEYEFYADFWEYDGQNWRKINVPTPPARAEASFVFDRKRRKAVLFGGYRIENGVIKPLSDTWEWDGKSWRKMAENMPSARSGAAVAYDERRKKVILFGGGIRSGGAHETWEWNGKIWRELKTAKTEPRYNSTMVYDPNRQRIIRFGGWDGTARVSETWEFDGEKWTKLNIESPEARNHTVMVYDRNRKKIILFGGHNGEFVFGDTWEFDGASWKKIVGVEPQKRVENGH